MPKSEYILQVQLKKTTTPDNSKRGKKIPSKFDLIMYIYCVLISVLISALSTYMMHIKLKIYSV